MKRKPRRTFECAHCGAQVPVGAAACPECGSDAETGWAEDAEGLGIDIPTGYGDDGFDYDTFLAEEGLDGSVRPGLRARRARRWQLGVFLLVALLAIWAVLT